MRRFATALLLALGACSSAEPGEGPSDGGTSPTDSGVMSGPYFHEDVELVLQENCQRCHRPDGIGPFSMLSYQDTQPWAARIAQVVADRSMPPWLAHETDECQPPAPFAADIRLDDAEIALLQAWAQNGAPQGDRGKAPPAKVFPPDNLANATHVLTSSQAARVMPGRDDFRCFVLDPKLEETTYVSGINFVPDNPKVVHHALLFLDATGASDALVGPDGSYECFGGPGFSDTQVLLAWAPGAQKIDLPPEIALRMTAGSKIILQAHYHPTADSVELDRSTVELRTTTVKPDWVMQILLIGNFGQPLGDDGLLPGPNDRAGPEFRIPAGEAAHVEQMRFTLPQRTGTGLPIPALKIVSVGTHMHYVGTDMKWSLEHPQPLPGEVAMQCMVQTPRWNFEWQRGYAFDVPIEDAPEFRPGDRLHLRCTYNNTMNNPFVARALREQNKSAPEDVLLGEETLDEMCLAVMTIAYRNPF